MTPTHSSKDDKIRPVAIGGVGGSGTSIAARLVRALGIHIGNDLNHSLDNLSYTVLFRNVKLLSADPEHFKLLFSIFSKSMRGNSPFSHAENEVLDQLLSANNSHRGEPRQKRWYASRIQNLRQNASRPASTDSWGWKEPNTHIFLDRFYELCPSLRYIHVDRHGLDVATSPNQRQRARWATFIAGMPLDDSPRDALKYWLKVHERLDQIRQQRSGQYMVLPYDRLCCSPEAVISELCEFLDLPHGDTEVREMALMVRKPSSLGRYRKLIPQEFDSEDIAQVSARGYSIDSQWLAHQPDELVSQKLSLESEVRSFVGAAQWDRALLSARSLKAVCPEAAGINSMIAELQILVRFGTDARSGLENLRLGKRPNMTEYIAISRRLASAGQYDDAVQLCESVIRAFGENWRVLLNLGRFQSRAGAHKEARDNLRKALELQPDCGEAHIALARDFLAEGRTAEARKVCDTGMLQVSKPHAGLFRTLGEIERRAGNREAAVDAYERSAAHHPNERVYRALSGLYRALHKPERAEAALSKANELRFHSRG